MNMIRCKILGFILETKTQDTHISYNPVANFYMMMHVSSIKNLFCDDD